MSAGWRRRRFIVRGFQGQFVVRQLVWLTVYLLAFAAALLAPLASTLHNGSPDERFHAAAQFLLFHEYLWPALGGVPVVAAAALIKTSHRIAGPLYRFRRVFSEVTAGNLRANARVRRGDYLALESDALEVMLASLRERIGAAQQAIDAAEHALRVESRSGYTRGLRGEQIDPLARILALADTFDAIRSDRPYRAGATLAETVATIRSVGPRHFAPDVLRAFESLVAAGALEPITDKAECT